VALSLALLARFERTGDLADADAAIEAAQAAVAQVRDPVVRGVILTNLSNAFSARFEQTRDLTDAAAAIGAGRAAVEATPRDHPRYPVSLSNLGGPLRARHEQVGELADLNEAIASVRAASRCAPGDHPLRAAVEANLASLLHDRFRASGELADLDDAVTASRAAVRLAARPVDSPAALTGLCGILHARFQRTRQAADLEEAIVAGQKAVDELPPGHPLRAYAMHACSLAHAARYHWQSHDLDDLGRAIEAGEAAVAAAPAGHPNLVGYLSNLGSCLQARYTVTGDRRDLAAAFARWRDAVGVRSGPARYRVQVAALLGSVAAENGAIAEAEAGYAQAIALLPLEAWHGLSQRARQQHLTRRPGLASDAAACAITAGHPERAVTLLEQGRSVLWAQALHLREEFDELRRAHPGLARRLDVARAVLDPSAGPDTAADDPAPGREGRDETRIRAADEWDRVLAAVRAIPQFASFLEPPPFAELASGIGPGPVVVVNVSRYRCDALIVTPAGVRVVPLLALTRDAAAAAADRYHQTLAEVARSGWTPAARQVIDEILGWLWDAVAEPVLNALTFTAPPADGRPWPRVWWCPTGPLTALPLHAAGYHQSAQAGLDQAGAAVIERVVSSYTPTLRALHRARGKPAPGRHPRPRVLLVAMPQTPGLPPGASQPGAEREADVVAAAFPGSVTARTGRAATRARVLADLDGHALVHFACHGGIDPAKPEESGLFLADGRLTIADLSRHQLPPAAAELAYLSACSTGFTGGVLPDEVITVAAALQLAGFQHVVATFWPISDRIAPGVAEDFYRHLAAAAPSPDGVSAAQALHTAIRQLRGDGSPAQWAPFFHAGP
jgi:tetratricopeptide (TPR) repeat protein